MRASNTKMRALFNQYTVRVIDALHDGPRRFTDLYHLTGAASEAIFSRQLRKMMRDGLITRARERGIYVLTPLGVGMAKVASPMVRWIDENFDQVELARLCAAAQKNGAVDDGADDADQDHLSDGGSA